MHEQGEGKGLVWAIRFYFLPLFMCLLTALSPLYGRSLMGAIYHSLLMQTMGQPLAPLPIPPLLCTLGGKTASPTFLC